MEDEHLNESVLSERDRIYLQILQYGLIGLRAAAKAGESDYCAVEADHLHNLPSLVGEPNELRHEYYYEKERTLYLERVDRSITGVEVTLMLFERLWAELGKLRGSAD
jgi:hypothetical protein